MSSEIDKDVATLRQLNGLVRSLGNKRSADLADAALDRLAEKARKTDKPDTEPMCNYCGLLGWTVKQWGRVTHKEA